VCPRGVEFPENSAPPHFFNHSPHGAQFRKMQDCLLNIEDCGEEIIEQRLAAMIYAIYCLGCASQNEARKKD